MQWPDPLLDRFVDSDLSFWKEDKHILSEIADLCDEEEDDD